MTILVCLIAFALSAHAGNYDEDLYLGENESYSYNSIDQSLSGDDSTFNYVAMKVTKDSVASYIGVSLEAVSGTKSDVKIYLDLSLYPIDRNIIASTDTVTWSGASDTTFQFNTNTNALFYQLRFEKAGDAFKINVEYLDFIFLK